MDSKENFKKALQTLPEIASTSWIGGSSKEFLKNPTDFLLNGFAQKGESFLFRTGKRKIAIFSNPIHHKQIFSKAQTDLRKESDVSDFLGNGLLAADGEMWVRQRKHAQSYFSKKHLSEFVPSLGKKIEKKKLELRVGQEVSLTKFVTDLVYELALEMIFNVEFKGRPGELADAFYNMADFIQWRARQFIKFPLNWPLPKHLAFRTSKRLFNDLVSKIDRQATEQGKENLLSFFRKDPLASPQEIEDQALTFFLASFETTINGILWVFDSVLRNREYWQKLRQEASSCESLDTFDAVKNLDIAQACVCEGLRLFPPAWFRSHVAKHDTSIGEYSVPAGVSLWVSIFLTHRNPNLWKNPEVYDPTRFEAAHRKHLVAGSFIPFGGGATVCIGRDMAMMEMTMLLSLLAKSFDFELKNKEPLGMLANITLRPSREIFVKVL